MSKKIRIFATVPRNLPPREHVGQLLRLARFSDEAGLAGILLFAGNDTLIEPWPMAQHVLAHTRSCAPLIAVNPAYMHPFTVAKFVTSLALLHSRKLFLNMITGAATSDLQSLGETLSHSDRYARLAEFIEIVRQLLSSTRPLTFRGQFYSTEHLQLRPALPPALMPEFLIAGQSEAAHLIARDTGCLMMQMLPPDLDKGVTSPGVNLGIFARPTRDQAVREATMLFRDDAEKRALLDYSMAQTDSVWKRQLRDAGQSGDIHDNGYWLLPYLTFESDCPYLVGSYDEIGARLRRLAEQNVTTMILDVIADEAELAHIRKALAAGEVI
ncbi:LLM class flavin-dependent oxidoreductase [Bradyrhizobium sp. HKCCYLS20291]|uniref:LLM class flavin-dependent oxidoreductase n=1 Tax=Bradyrhizobium sp. HKCCYLS20291 TaxID=3420766 RepID=UPI003EB721D1